MHKVSMKGNQHALFLVTAPSYIDSSSTMLSKCLEYFDKHSSEKTFLLKRGVKATWKGLFACFNYLWISIGGFIFCCYKKAVFRSWKDYQLF